MTTIARTLVHTHASAVQDPVAKVVHYLLQYPCDLVHASRMMRRLQVSAEEFQQALDRLEQLYGASEN